MKNPNADRCSGLPALWACPSSWSEVPGDYVAESVPAGILGTVVHAGCAALVRTGDIDEGLLAMAEHPQFGEVDPDEAASLLEPAFAAWQEIGPALPEPTTETAYQMNNSLSGHIDVDSLPGFALADWKSGWRDLDHTHQMAGYAALRFNAQPKAEKITTYVIWLRFQAIDKRVWTRDEIEAWWAEYNTRVAEIGNVYRPGEVCSYCPNRPTCEDYAQWQGGNALVLTGSRSALVRANIPAMYPRLVMLEKACKEVRAWIREQVKLKQVPLDGGYALRAIPGKREEIDAEKAWPWLESTLSREELSRVVTIRKTELKGILSARAEKGEKAAAWNGSLAGLRAINALKTREIEPSVRKVKV